MFSFFFFFSSFVLNLQRQFWKGTFLVYQKDWRFLKKHLLFLNLQVLTRSTALSARFVIPHVLVSVTPEFFLTKKKN
jgi:hypothetical protein